MKPQLKAHFSVDWRQSDKESTDELLKLLTKTFVDHGVRRPKSRKKNEAAVQKPKKQQKRKRKLVEEGEQLPDDDQGDKMEIEESNKNTLGSSILRNDLFVGLRSIIRAIEKEQTNVVFIDCQSLKPSALGLYFGALVVNSNACGYAIPGLSQSLSSVLNLPSVRALAFKKSDNVLFDEVFQLACNRLKSVIYKDSYPVLKYNQTCVVVPTKKCANKT